MNLKLVNINLIKINITLKILINWIALAISSLSSTERVEGVWGLRVQCIQVSAAIVNFFVSIINLPLDFDINFEDCFLSQVYASNAYIPLWNKTNKRISNEKPLTNVRVQEDDRYHKKFVKK